jgi:hypothetical protein
VPAGMSRKYEEDERMQAKHGSGHSLRGRIRLMCTAAIVLALSALVFAGSASALVAKERQLSLGDSLAFGYSQQLFNENEKLGEPPTGFEHGYPNTYLSKHKPILNKIQLINDGCPGETSGGLIGNGPLGAALAAPPPAGAGATIEEPCAYHYTAGLPLHHTYSGLSPTTPSQLEDALGVIAQSAAEGKPVTDVTFNIGANDELHEIGKCKAEVKAEWEALGKSPQYGGKTEEESFTNCITQHVPALFEKIIKNIGAAMFTLREGSKFGGINYTGKIVLLGGYDPYGNVFGTGELLGGSRSLTIVLNQEEVKNLVTPFGLCFANPQPKFNPGTKYEPIHLQKWTNMANFTEFEGKKDGPDIHPTPEGYKVLGTVMFQQCG